MHAGTNLRKMKMLYPPFLRFPGTPSSKEVDLYPNSAEVTPAETAQKVCVT